MVKTLREMVDDKLLEGNINSGSTQWIKSIPKKVNVFIWRLIRDRVPVRKIIDDKGIDIHSVLCPRCNNDVESMDHCFVNCVNIKEIWMKVFKWWNLGSFTYNSVNQILDNSGNFISSRKEQELWKAVSWCTLYLIWRNRNFITFNNQRQPDFDLFYEIKVTSFFWISHRIRDLGIDWKNWYIGVRN